jgi:LmbE family N-acetylglucosaminyl deacetylase
VNILAIGAHFDDVELGCGGAIVRHVANGDRVFVYVATVSGFANHRKTVIRSSKVASDEGKRAVAILGAKLICGTFDTFEVEFCEALTVDIIKIVEEKNIDMVYTHWVGDIHHDHRAVAYSSLHSCRHIPRMLMYRSNWYHSDKDFRGNFYIDISSHWAKKEEAIRAHRSEIVRTRERWINFFKNEAENAGQRIGVKYAEVFEMIKWLW